MLLLRRIPQKGGFWQGVTGAPEADESDSEAAVREVREETGFGVEVEPLDFRYDLHRSEEARGLWLELYGDDDIDTIPEEAFAAEVDSGAEPVIDPVEHDGFRWCSFNEAESLLKWEENRRALQRLRERIDD